MEVDGITWLHCPILLDSWNSSKLLLGHGEFHTDRLAAAKAFAAYGDFMYLPSQDMAASENKDTPRWMVSDALPSYSLVLVDTMVIGDGLFYFLFSFGTKLSLYPFASFKSVTCFRVPQRGVVLAVERRATPKLQDPR